MMKKLNSNKGFSIIESILCVLIIGIGFVAINQLTGHAIQSVDRSIEKNKVNFLAEMIIEDMIGNPTAATSSGFGSFNENCTYAAKSGNTLLVKQHNKWMDKLKAKQQIKINNKYKIPRCDSAKDKKKIHVINTKGQINSNLTGVRLNFFTGKGKQKKYLGVIVK